MFRNTGEIGRPTAMLAHRLKISFVAKSIICLYFAAAKKPQVNLSMLLNDRRNSNVYFAFAGVGVWMKASAGGMHKIDARQM